MNEVEHVILHVVDAYKTAVFTKNIDAFVALYDQDVQVFDMWGEWSYTGSEAWRGMVTESFGSLATERVVVNMHGLQTMGTHDVAVAHGFVTYTGVSAEGIVLRTMQNRLTWALKHIDNTWKIIHEHSSAPVDFETSKVMLQP